MQRAIMDPPVVTAPTIPRSGGFGVLLRTLRENKGWSQHDAALKFGLAPTYLCAVERAKRPAPEQHVAQRIANVLELGREGARELVEQALSSRCSWIAEKALRRSTRQPQASSCSPEHAALSSVMREAELIASHGRVRVVITFEPLDIAAANSTHTSNHIRTEPLTRTA